MREKVNTTITSYLDVDGNHKDNNNISFNKNSIVHTSIQIPNKINNETFEFDYHID